MPERQIDPARLEGEALRRWYQRPPDEIERERQAGQAQRYQAFFGQSPAEPDRDARSAREPSPPVASPDGVLWIANGRGGFRAITSGSSDFEATRGRDGASATYLPSHTAKPEEREYQEIGSKSRQHRRDWERREGRAWPTVAETGQNHHVSHIEARGDGGSDTLDNIEPEDPVKHMERHRENGDFARWGKRGGRPKGPVVKGLGVLGIIPNITGMLSGRIRMDSLDNFSSDMLGYPSQEDVRRSNEDFRRRYFPSSKPGDLVA